MLGFVLHKLPEKKKNYYGTQKWKNLQDRYLLTKLSLMIPCTEKRLNSTLVALNKSENSYMLYGISRVKKIKNLEYLR